MSDDTTLDDILAQLGGTTGDVSDKEETPETPEAKELEVDETPVEVKEEDPLAGLLVGEETEPEPAPVPKKRGRPKGSTTKKATAIKAEAPKVEEPKTTTITADSITGSNITAESVVDGFNAHVVPDLLPQVQLDNSTTQNEVKVEVTETKNVQTKDIYILSEAQILNGSVYRRGQKITFTPGDKFYNSQFDRDGKNWLDLVDDLDAQYAHFGRLIVEPNQWTGIPLGSTEGVTHPGMALALAKIAQEEYERNGTPYN